MEKKNIIEMFWSRFTYRTTYLFLFGVWNILENVPYVFLRGYGFNNISFNIDRITWNIMFNSLTVYHPWTSAFEVVDIYSTRTIDLLDNVATSWNCWTSGQDTTKMSVDKENGSRWQMQFPSCMGYGLQAKKMWWSWGSKSENPEWGPSTQVSP